MSYNIRTLKQVIKLILKSLSRLLSSSFIFTSAKKTWIKNQRNINLSLSKAEKFYVGTYLILLDYSQDIFPPVFVQSVLYENEIYYSKDLSEQALVKPFWSGSFFYLEDFVNIFKLFSQFVPVNTKILELGAGGGWLAEFLAIAGYDVCASTISDHDIKVIKTRSNSLKTKQIDRLSYVKTAMEAVDKTCEEKYKAIYCYEALHHAYSWKDTLKASYNCLEDGGFLLILKEPNLFHTFVSYRIAKLTNTHEIGFKSWELIPFLDDIGFSVKYQKPRLTMFNSFWIVCQKKS